jgi:hypothetical protein
MTWIVCNCLERSLLIDKLKYKGLCAFNSVDKFPKKMFWPLISVQAKPVANKLALARRVSVSYFASSALLSACLVTYLSVKALRAEGPISYLSVKALRVEGPVSYLSIAALRAQRNRSYIEKKWALRAHVLMQPNEFDACARSCVPWRTFVTEVRRGHILR